MDVSADCDGRRDGLDVGLLDEDRADPVAQGFDAVFREMLAEREQGMRARRAEERESTRQRTEGEGKPRSVSSTEGERRGESELTRHLSRYEIVGSVVVRGSGGGGGEVDIEARGEGEGERE